jgi:hypothetical protein
LLSLISFQHLTESTTTKKSPSPSAVEVVSKFKSILAIGTVPEDKLDAFKLVKDAPLPENVVAEAVPVTVKVEPSNC